MTPQAAKTYRLVLPLKFKVILLVRRAFSSVEEANLYWDAYYRSFPAFEIWEQAEVDRHTGTIYPIGN